MTDGSNTWITGPVREDVDAAFLGHFALALVTNPTMRCGFIFRYLTAPPNVEGIAA